MKFAGEERLKMKRWWSEIADLILKREREAAHLLYPGGFELEKNENDACSRA